MPSANVVPAMGVAFRPLPRPAPHLSRSAQTSLLVFNESIFKVIYYAISPIINSNGKIKKQDKTLDIFFCHLWSLDTLVGKGPT